MQVAPTKHGMEYLNLAFGDGDRLINDAKRVLAGVEFDTFVGTGMSGALVVPLLGRAMGKHFMIVRKPNDGSHGVPCEGYLGERWVFVDDFISSGATRNRVKDAMKAHARTKNVFVGTYTYGAGWGVSQPANQTWYPAHGTPHYG